MRRWLSEEARAERAQAWRTVRSLRPGELRRRWGELQELRTALFDRGGLTVDSPSGLGGDDPPIHARTVIQPDGDSLWMIESGAVGDEQLLAGHAEAVRRVYDHASATVTVLGVYLSAVQAALAGLAAVVAEAGALLRWGWMGAPVGLVVPIVLAGLLRWILGTALRKGLRARLV